MPFEFDNLRRLAQEDPAAFEAHRHARFDVALLQASPALQSDARAMLERLQSILAHAANPDERLAVSLVSLNDAVLKLRQMWVEVEQQMKFG